MSKLLADFCINPLLFEKKKLILHSKSARMGCTWEGHSLYPNAGFAEKDHIQICVCNPNCIKGYFLPRGIDTAYPNP